MSLLIFILLKVEAQHHDSQDPGAPPLLDNLAHTSKLKTPQPLVLLSTTSDPFYT